MGMRAGIAAASAVLGIGGCLSQNPAWDELPPEQNGQAQGADEALVLYRFDEGAGSIVRDVSGQEPALDLEVPSSFTWTPTGLESSGAEGAVSKLPAGRVAAAVAVTEAVTVELWVTPSAEMTTDTGPHRMVSNSISAYQRNFTLGVVEGTTTGWVARIRTSSTGDNGTPELVALEERLPQKTHVVFTHEVDGRDSLYVQGVLIESRELGVPLLERDGGLAVQRELAIDTDTDTDGPASGGDTDSTTTSDSGTTGPVILESGRLEGWAAGYPIIIGNELQDARGFLGEFHHVAVYDRALTADEVTTRFEKGEP